VGEGANEVQINSSLTSWTTLGIMHENTAVLGGSKVRALQETLLRRSDWGAVCSGEKFRAVEPPIGIMKRNLQRYTSCFKCSATDGKLSFHRGHLQSKSALFGVISK
jgi:hypothetical protein